MWWIYIFRTFAFYVYIFVKCKLIMETSPFTLKNIWDHSYWSLQMTYKTRFETYVRAVMIFNQNGECGKKRMVFLPGKCMHKMHYHDKNKMIRQFTSWYRLKIKTPYAQKQNVVWFDFICVKCEAATVRTTSTTAI